MNACKNCGMEIKWRTISGQRIPMGCECGDEDLRRSSASVGESFTREIRCPKCCARVYFVRHNGGSVWLDELGQPWPKHPCFDNQGSTEGLDEWLAAKETKIVGKIAKVGLKTEYGQKIVHISVSDDVWELYPAPEFWLITPEPAVGEQVVLNSVTRIFQIRNRFDFRYWRINPTRCGCGEIYLSWRYHKERCKSGGTIHRF